MSTRHNDYRSMSHADQLNAIHRLRLLCNTTGEMSAHTHIQLRNNSFNRKTPFIARCIHSEFCREALERTQTDLDELMADYCDASRSFEKIAKTRRAQPAFFREVLRCRLDERFAASEEAIPYREAAESFPEVDEAILTLLVLNILPSFQAKGGDVDPNSLLGHLIHLRDYFQPLYKGSQIFAFTPFLTEMYQHAVRRIRDGEPYTRLELIDFTREIIANLKNNYNPSSLLQANRHCAQQKIHPDLEQGVWMESDCCGRNPVCWVFEGLGEDYILTRREFDAASRRITEIRYEMLLLGKDEEEGGDEGDMVFQLLRQSEIVHVCQGKPIPEQAYMCGICRIDDPMQPTVIEWEFTTNRYDDFPRRMVRTEQPDAVPAIREDWKIVCKTGDFEYLPVERAVTPQHVYVERTSRLTTSGEREIVSWYRIPRQGLLLEEDLMQTTLARIRHDDRIYINFVVLNRTYDVTDAESCAAAGITITDRIEVVVPAE